MKKFIAQKPTYSFIAGTVLLAALVCAACDNSLNPAHRPGGENPSGQPSGGTGLVKISIDGLADTSARTVFPVKPDVEDLFYTYAFTKGDEPKNLTPDGAGVYTLETGDDWSVTVTAYDDEEHTNKVGTGSKGFTVTDSAAVQEINVTLYPAIDGEGIFKYTLTNTYAAGTLGAFTLTPTDGTPGTEIDLTEGLAVGVNTKTVHSGYYELIASLADDTGRTAGKIDVVHIYNGMTTTVVWTFVEADFTAILVESAGITGLVAPVTGEPPVAMGDLNVAANAHYIVESIVWDQALDAGTFKPLTTYTAEIVLKASSGYKFSGAITPTVDEGTVSGPVMPSANAAMNTLTFTVSFPVTGAYDPGQTPAPTFDNPIVPKTTVTQDEVTFALNSSIDSTYATVQVYDDDDTADVSTTVQGEYSAGGTDGLIYLFAIPKGNPVPAGTYWVTLTATDFNGYPIKAPSARVGPLTVEEAPLLAGAVAITGYNTDTGGAPLIGRELTADLSALVDPNNANPTGPKSPGDYSYQWYHISYPNAIDGATAQTFTPSIADLGYPLLVRVSRNSSYVESLATTAVAKAITNGDGLGINGLVAPVIGGTPVTGVNPAGSDYTAAISWQKEDPANPGTWSNNGATTFVAGSRYRATIRLTANEGYQLVNETTTPAYPAIIPKVNGVTASEDWTISPLPGLEASGGLAGAGANGPHSPGNYLEFWVTFPATPVPTGVSFSWNPLNHTVGVDTSALTVNPVDGTIHVDRVISGNHGTVAFSVAAPEGGSYTDLRWTLDGKDVDGPAGTGATYTFDAYPYEPNTTHRVGLKVKYDGAWYGDSTNVVITITE